jgi:gamma-glutamylcyclotransferase (GGCT)/AIG2-like uncharacterized protein YtfP
MGKLQKLFVYGIFLDENNRRAFGMHNPEYAVVADYATYTIGGSIVMAYHVPGAGLGLTGLVCDVEPSKWERLDQLEGAYDRITITTKDGERAWMYVAPNEE